ncbi:N4-gp56 family major capsid protein [Stappia indica]|uniref:N4-gp56 family major capsid protein n=1 Tax=Stappia indica TaxID=538381 RepID=UPI001CD5D186|nr:N4-gp56 family major capsid protein [Stappia indica]MCA1298033.1 N4-gp56 family major capsid protein [Stappia indica]
MSVTSYGVNDALAVKAWSKKLAHEASKATPIAPLIGTGDNSIIRKKTELSKSAGDKVTVGLRRQLSQAGGVTENQLLEGNEESLTTFSDALVINEIAHAVRVKNNGTIDTQRVPFNLRNEGKGALADWYADRMSLMAFTQLCGYTAPTITFEGETFSLNSTHWGFNLPSAPSANRKLFVNGSTDEANTSAHVMTLTMIDYAVELAKTANPKIRPIRVGGEKKYVMYLHPYQVKSLRTNTSTGQWLDIQKAAMAGGQVTKNPIYSGALGEYNGVILRESEHVTPGVHSSTGEVVATVRRAILLGGDAAMFGVGQEGRETSYKLVEKTFDYDRELGIAAKNVMGMKKCVYDGEDFGVVTISSYAAAGA